jgi:hypothetical protein
VSLLSEASDKCIVKCKVDFFKFWWDEEGDALKNDSIVTHRNWCAVGRPKTGVLFDAKKKAKSRYKLYLRQHMQMKNDEVSNSLHDSLINKDQSTFWKVWKKKFGVKNVKQDRINGLVDNYLIAKEFSSFFVKTSNENVDRSSHKAMLDRLLCYMGDPLIGCQFVVEVISDIILNLRKSKAIGCDNLSAEHLQFCHPTIIVIISKLFNMMVLLGYVPLGLVEELLFLSRNQTMVRTGTRWKSLEGLLSVLFFLKFLNPVWLELLGYTLIALRDNLDLKGGGV